MSLTKLEAWLIAGVVVLVLALVAGAVWHHDVTAEQKAKDTAATAALVLKQVQDNAADADRRRTINQGIIHDLQAKLANAPVDTGRIVRGLCDSTAGTRSVPPSPGGTQRTDGAPAVSGSGETLADEYVAACRADATRLAAWQEWAIKQGLPVE